MRIHRNKNIETDLHEENCACFLYIFLSTSSDFCNRKITISETTWILKCELRIAMKNIKCQNYSELAPKLPIRQFRDKLKRWQWRTVADRQFDVKLQMNEFGSLSTRQAIYMLFLCESSFVSLATKIANEKIRKWRSSILGRCRCIWFQQKHTKNESWTWSKFSLRQNRRDISNYIVKTKFNPFNAFCGARWRMTPIINAVASICSLWANKFVRSGIECMMHKVQCRDKLMTDNTIQFTQTMTTETDKIHVRFLADILSTIKFTRRKLNWKYV